MARADVVVIGAGLAGLTAAARLAETGARVTLVAKGHTRTHWGSGGLDVAAPAGARTPGDGIGRLASGDHPYALLAADADPALAWMCARLAAAGLPYAGNLESPIRRAPTAIGATRPVAVVPHAQAAALRPWMPDETLVVAGIAGFKDFWPAAIAAGVARPEAWQGEDRPARVVATTVEFDGLHDRRNLNALVLAHRLDDPGRRARDIDRIARAVDAAAGGRPGRVAVPAVVGLDHHADAWADLVERLRLEPFEVPLVPPSIPGMRLWSALRATIRDAGGRVQVGESVARIAVERGRAVAVDLHAASRHHRIRTGAVVLATGGIVGGGLVATADGRIVEPLLDLPVEAPGVDAWLDRDALAPEGHPIEAVGIRTDAALRPLDPGTDRPILANVHVAGALLAGGRALRQRCGDGVAIASGWRAAAVIAGGSDSRPPVSSGAPRTEP